MPNSWDQYFSNYSDWDDAHCFNVRIELKFEDEIKRLGYAEYVSSDDIYLESKYTSNEILPICLLYTSPSPRDLSTSRMPSSA